MQKLFLFLSLMAILLSTGCGMAAPSARPAPSLTIRGEPTKPRSFSLPEVTAYPAPVTPTPPELETKLQEAYPGMWASETAVVKTITAMPTATVTPTPTIPPTLTPIPTRQALVPPLPAPLYRLATGFRPSEGDQPDQIWKLTKDGLSFFPVTAETKGVDNHFDVSKDGMLAYTVENQLIITDAEGKYRRVLVEGQARPDQADDDWFSRDRIASPAWSPDGKRIAYRLNGINVIDVASGKITKIVKEEDPFVTMDGKKVPSEMSRVHYDYHPFDWTPDGSRIIIQGLGYEWMTTFIVPAVPGAKAVRVETIFNDYNFAGCCDYSFAKAGKMLFSSGDHSYIGLWRIDPRTGKGVNLTVPLNKQNFGSGPWIFLPKEAPDGRIFFFTTKTGDDSDPWMSLAYVDGKKFPFRVPEDVTYVKSEQSWQGALWFPDASRVIVEDHYDNLWILDATTGLATPLNIQGYALRWGAKE